jgi:hypothetical protein
MPEPYLPLFPSGVVEITDLLAVKKEGGEVTYFNGLTPVFRHPENDVATFRMITSQFCVTGCARQSDIIRAFGVTPISVKRSVKIYREKGPSGFYTPRAARGAAVLVDTVIAEAEQLLSEGASEAEVAAKLELKPNTLHKAIRAGRVRSPVKKNLR